MVRNNFGERLDDFIARTFHLILRAEERSIKESGKPDLSISEIHLIVAVSLSQHAKITVGDLATSLQVTSPTATAAINRLQAKGYLERVTATHDTRKVYVTLTEQGEAAVKRHELFHQRMVDAILCNFTLQEKDILLRGVAKLNEFFADIGKAY